MQNTPGHVVNGGLIDFQDNFYRGAPDYSNYMQGQHGGISAMQPFASPATLQAMQQQHVFAGGLPGLQAGGSLPCISGPPAYLHVNGQTYVPVDAQQPVAASKPAGPAVSGPASTEGVPRVLTEEEIERRVRNRVEEWAAGQRKPVYYTGAASGGSSSRRVAKGREVSEEDRAADRIKSVNANMRGRFVSPF
jgi:hypothetical protein